jgi:hypothetical protein
MNTNEQNADQNAPTTNSSLVSRDVENEVPNTGETQLPDDLSTEDHGRRNHEQTYDFLIDGVDYFVRIVPFEFNDETRYKISVNDGPQHIFLWDEQVMQIRSLDDSAAVLPDTLETEISQKLISSR